MRIYKVLMLPTRKQKRELKRCFDVSRHVFNFANYRIRKHGDAINFCKLRNLWTKQPPLPWGLNVATRIQQHAIKHCVDAYTSNLAKGGAFEVKYRSLDSTDTEVIVIEKDEDRHAKTSRRVRFEPLPKKRRYECLLHLGNNLAKYGGFRLLDSKKVIEKLLKESAGLKEQAKIQWDKRINRFYFIYAYVQPKLEDPDPTFERKRIVAMDPGMTPFQEWYSPTTGEFGELLDGAKDQKYARCVALDKLQRRIAHRRKEGQERVPSLRRRRSDGTRRQQQKRYRSTTRRLRKRYRRQCARMRGWMERGHYAAAEFLLNKHEIVIQPILHVKRLTNTEERDLNSAGARAMITWGHYQFRQRLKSVASRHAGCYVYETTEPGTSKTCTHCGFWKANLQQGDKIYNCPQCHLSVDRQLAGARNNFFAAYGLAVGRGWDRRSG